MLKLLDLPHLVAETAGSREPDEAYHVTSRAQSPPDMISGALVPFVIPRRVARIDTGDVSHGMDGGGPDDHLMAAISVVEEPQDISRALFVADIRRTPAHDSLRGDLDPA